MQTIFIISLIVFIVSVLIIFYLSGKKIETGGVYTPPVTGGVYLAWILSLLLLVISGIGGLVIAPLAVNYKTTYEQVYDYQVFNSNNTIVIDLSNSSVKNYYQISPFKKFNSYNIVTNYSDSTRIYIEKNKSFYGTTIEKHIVWSNPPYNYYNVE